MTGNWIVEMVFNGVSRQYAGGTRFTLRTALEHLYRENRWRDLMRGTDKHHMRYRVIHLPTGFSWPFDSTSDWSDE